MSENVRNKLMLSNSDVNNIEVRMKQLDTKGVKIPTEHSGESNFMGCRTGYCQAWD